MDIHCKIGVGFVFACGVSHEPPKHIKSHAALEDFKPMMKLETMKVHLCEECAEVVAASERQVIRFPVLS